MDVKSWQANVSSISRYKQGAGLGWNCTKLCCNEVRFFNMSLNLGIHSKEKQLLYLIICKSKILNIMTTNGWTFHVQA